MLRILCDECGNETFRDYKGRAGVMRVCESKVGKLVISAHVQAFDTFAVKPGLLGARHVEAVKRDLCGPCLVKLFTAGTDYTEAHEREVVKMAEEQGTKGVADE